MGPGKTRSMNQMEVRQLNRLSRQLREIALRASQNGAELPLSVSELAIVEHVARHPAETITSIARSTGFAQSRVSTVVRALTDQGVLVCSRNVKDRRQTRVQLDPKVAELTFQEYGSRPVEHSLREVLPHLSGSDAARAGALLDELAALLSPPS